jgi:hypothetical protein
MKKIILIAVVSIMIQSSWADWTDAFDSPKPMYAEDLYNYSMGNNGGKVGSARGDVNDYYGPDIKGSAFGAFNKMNRSVNYYDANGGKVGSAKNNRLGW